jgi:hypothetical protein
VVEVADAMGLSTVHVNRMLQQLRGERLIASCGNTITVLDWPRLQQAGEFTPDYLFLGSIDGNGAARPPAGKLSPEDSPSGPAVNRSGGAESPRPPAGHG